MPFPAFLPLPSLPLRPAQTTSSNTPIMGARRKPKRLNLFQAALLAAGTLAGNVSISLVNPRTSITLPLLPAAHAEYIAAPTSTAPIPLSALGVRREEYVSERELRRRKTTQYSEAEQEIMELEEWEVESQWFRNLQALWAGIASVGGIYVLYRGGVMWENWIRVQEQKDMEEEIKLTGTFIDPRAVRKDEGDEDGEKPEEPKQPKPDAPTDEDSGDAPGSVDSLDKLFGQG